MKLFNRNKSLSSSTQTIDDFNVPIIPTTEKDLANVKSLNTSAYAGEVASSNPYGVQPNGKQLPIPRLDQGAFAKTNGFKNVDFPVSQATGVMSGANNDWGSFQWNIITTINRWHLDKFDFKGIDIDVESLNNTMFWYGSAIVFPWKDNVNGYDYVATNYTVIEKDIFNNPKIVQPIFPNGSAGAKMTVNKDCVLWFGGYNWIYNTKLLAYGIAFQIWNRVNELGIIAYIVNRNVLINRPRYINFVQNQNDISGLKIQQQLDDFEKDVINVDMSGLDLQKVSGMSAKDGIIDMKNQFDFLERQYYFKLDQIKGIIGAKTNASESKKERLISDEVNADNQMSNTGIGTELKYAKQFVDRFNKTFSQSANVELSGNFSEEIELPELPKNDKGDKNE